MHAIWVPDAQVPCRTYRTVSKLVVPPQVWMVDVPDTLGVHWKTVSGDVLVVAHVPASELVPDVVPENTPPAGGITVGAVQELAGSVDVVELVVVLEVVVLDVVLELVLLVVDVDVTVELVVVVGATGGVTVSVNPPLLVP